MGEDTKWLIGIAASMIVSFSIALIGSFKSLAASLKAGDDALMIGLIEPAMITSGASIWMVTLINCVKA